MNSPGQPVIRWGSRPLVHTDEGQVRARYVLLCGNAYLGDLVPEIRSRIMPIANHLLATEPLGAARAAALIPADCCVHASKFVVDYYRLSPDGRLIFGGGETYRDRPPRDLRAFVRRYMLEVFPQLADVRIEYALERASRDHPQPPAALRSHPGLRLLRARLLRPRRRPHSACGQAPRRSGGRHRGAFRRVRRIAAPTLSRWEVGAPAPARGGNALLRAQWTGFERSNVAPARRCPPPAAGPPSPAAAGPLRRKGCRRGVSTKVAPSPWIA